MHELTEALKIEDLPPGTQKTVQLGTRRVLLCHEADSCTVWAIEDECSHAFQPLAGGKVRGGTIQCPKHGARFDLRTGAPLNGIAIRPVPVYAVRIEGNCVLVAQAPSKP